MSLLSKDLKRLFECSTEGCEAVPEFQDEEFRINWDTVIEYLCEDYEGFNLNFENCLSVAPKLHSLCRHLQRLLENRELGNDPEFLWTGNHSDNLRSILKTIQRGDGQSDGIKVLADLLRTTAILERSLGDIYCTNTGGKTPPHLLKDLLVSQEVGEVLSKPLVFFLRLLLGHPESLNIRNICWHGFPVVDEIPEYFLAAILVAFGQIERMIGEKGIVVLNRSSEGITRRTFNLFQKISLQCPGRIDDCPEIIRKSAFVSQDHFEIWEYILSHRNETSLVLICPQLELILRRIYGVCNGIDVTAKIEEYYIILDTFLEEQQQTGEINAIHERIDISLRLLIYDLFIAERGPRIRDKISHGEVRFDAEEINLIISHLIALTANLLLSFESEELFTPVHRSIFYCFEELRTSYISFQRSFGGLAIALEDPHPMEIYNRHQRFDQQLSKQLIKIIQHLSSGLAAMEQNQISLEGDERKEILLQNLRRTLVTIVQPNIKEIMTIIHLLITTLIPLDRTNSTLRTDAIGKLFKFLQRVQKIAENFFKYSQSNEWIRMQDTFRELVVTKIKHLVTDGQLILLLTSIPDTV